MARFEVIERKEWQHNRSGEKASIYGACPWFNDNDKAFWTIVSNGFTLLDTAMNQVWGPTNFREINHMNHGEVQALADRLNNGESE